jgi:hypothetical protein
VCPFRVFSPLGVLWSAGWTRVVAEEVAAGRVRQDALEPLAKQERGVDDPLRWHYPPGAPPPQPGFPFMSCDIGLYGEPGRFGFRCRRDVRALQRFVDVPAFWGMSFLTRAELEAVYDFAGYERVRAAYGASAGSSSSTSGSTTEVEGVGGAAQVPVPALLDIRDKASFCDLTAPDPGPVPAWRLVRSGLAPYTATAAVAIALGIAVWSAVWLARRSGAAGHGEGSAAAALGRAGSLLRKFY